jgi:hypothetical protein
MDDYGTSRARSIRAILQASALFMALGGIPLVCQGLLRSNYWDVAGGIGSITISVMGFRVLFSDPPKD